MSINAGDDGSGDNSYIDALMEKAGLIQQSFVKYEKRKTVVSPAAGREYDPFVAMYYDALAKETLRLFEKIRDGETVSTSDMLPILQASRSLPDKEGSGMPDTRRNTRGFIALVCSQPLNINTADSALQVWQAIAGISKAISTEIILQKSILEFIDTAQHGQTPPKGGIIESLYDFISKNQLSLQDIGRDLSEARDTRETELCKKYLTAEIARRLREGYGKERGTGQIRG